MMVCCRGDKADGERGRTWGGTSKTGGGGDQSEPGGAVAGDLVGSRLARMTVGMVLGPLCAGWAVLHSELGPLTPFLYSEYFLN
jgi:hypothetical protein